MRGLGGGGGGQLESRWHGIGHLAGLRTPSLAAACGHFAGQMSLHFLPTTADGKVRVWVETLVLTENVALGQPGPEAGSGSTPPRGVTQQQQHARRSPGSGSPGAAPSSPRDVRAAAAAAAALGTAAPAITSYFCMALLIDPAATAPGAAAEAAASSRSGAGGGEAQPAVAHVALWARHAGLLLLHKQQRRVAAPVMWLFTASVQPKPKPEGGGCQLLLQLHAVRGLAAIVMSAGYGGSLSSTSGASSSTRPAAVLWGQHAWELPAAAAGSCPAQLLRRLCCWVSDEEGFPHLHAFSSSSGGGGSLLLAGRTFSTVEDGATSHMQVSVTGGPAHAHAPLLNACSCCCCNSCRCSSSALLFHKSWLRVWASLLPVPACRRCTSSWRL